jgi:FKBP-type peptidyl-prolyl cis-trans isomerase
MIRKNNRMFFSFLAVVLIISSVSCDKENKKEKEEAELIQEYLNANNTLDFVKKPSGLYYLETLAGTGLIPAAHDTAYIIYTGKFLDGSAFSSNVGTTDTLIVPFYEDGFLISGFQEGITYMVEGGKSQFLFSSDLGYGANGSYPYISGYTPLLFEVEIIKVVSGPGK